MTGSVVSKIAEREGGTADAEFGERYYADYEGGVGNIDYVAVLSALRDCLC